MTTELKSEWVKALRSGEYKQGFGMLRDNAGGYCGLGVLGDVLSQKGAAMWGRYNRLECKGDGSFVSIPSKLREDIKFFRPLHDRAIFLNDVRRYTFLEIADWIETNIDVEDTPAV